MTSMLVAVLHKAEDKYTPVGEKPSALYIPDDAPEWELIAQLRGETCVDENPRKREIYSLIKAGKTVRQIASQLDIPISSIRDMIHRYGWSKLTSHEQRKLKKYDMYDANGKKMGRGTVAQLSAKFGISKTRLYGHTGGYNERVKQTKSFYLMKV
ncbi:hypothetical protein OXT66_07990 [Lentilactobacillus senioris]|uniref:helix-turn-helix transcriptional regulator n=1 Tax=Lentilactobacillus senioris TaxID=931534 RepID=UPI00227F674B|nr:hypothetical protein [Lentilactobacillus senioris]MCY9807473.1 hypothetical protein [Lentilactobacillus senioris]